MPRATQSIERTGRSTQRQIASPPGRHRRAPHCSLRTSATDVLTLAPASGLSLPSLAGLPESFTYRADSVVLLPVADYLIAQGHGTRREWNAAKNDLIRFIEQSINRLIRSTGFKRKVNYDPTMGAVLTDQERYQQGNLEESVLLLALDSSECGWFRMGPITRQMESTAQGLGAAFYAAVNDALWEVGWTYGYSEAQQMHEYQVEGIEDEEGKTWEEMSPAEREQYEVLNPDKAIPEHLKEVKNGGFTAERRDLLAKHKSGPHAKLVNYALQLGELAAELHYYKGETPEGDPLPSYLIYMEDHDAITQAFDDWARTALEGDITYHWQRTFHADKPEEIAKAFEAFTLAVRILAVASHLTPLVNGAK